MVLLLALKWIYLLTFLVYFFFDDFFIWLYVVVGAMFISVDVKWKAVMY